jgi:hypothetical protein
MSRNPDRNPLENDGPRNSRSRAAKQAGKAHAAVPTDSGRAQVLWLVASGCLAPLALLNSCSSGGGSATGSIGSSMAVSSCVLGCNGPAAGPLNCAVTNVFVNQEFWVEFTQPVNLSSVNKNTFQVVDTITGQSPAGTFSIDPVSNRRVIFRPKLTFDSSGNPVFGLTSGSSYRLSIPGVLSDAQGPYINSQGGQQNQLSLDCFISASSGVNDPVPGAPSVLALLEELDGGDVIASAPAQGQVGAALNSRLRFVFNDIMNPATLVNPATGISTFLKVSIDLDGNLNDTSDQLPLAGQYQIAIDEALKQTTVFFTPAGGFPTAGGDLENPRRVVVDLPPTIVDLGDNPLANAGRIDFVTETVPLAEVELAETFEDFGSTSLERTGTIFQPTAESIQTFYGPGLTVIGTETLTGRMLPGFGGGSGRLGDLIVEAGTTITLSTGPTIPTVFGPDLTTGAVDLNGNPTTVPAQIAAYHVKTRVIDNYADDEVEPGTTDIEVSDGVWEFASVQVDSGAIVNIVGENAPRFFVRGEFLLGGLVNLSGAAAPNQLSSNGFGGPGGLPAPGGGAGGRGADRPDNGGTQLISTLPNSTLKGFDHPPGTVFQIDGYQGIGRGGDAPIVGNDFGGGGGGVHWPTSLPGPLLTNLNGFVPNNICSSSQGGAPGAGGSYSYFGTAGQWAAPTPVVGVPPAPPLAIPGSNLLGASEVNLDPDTGGRLLGGSGGGGGGVGITLAKTNGIIFQCQNAPVGQTLRLVEYYDHSASGGGGGGGAIQIQAGRRVAIDGRLDLSGGEGGGPDSSSLLSTTRYAAPGGGGSGGALLLQTLDVALANIVGVVDISGGGGGFNSNVGDYLGGTGGPGVVQIQKSPAVTLSPAIEGPKLLTYLATPPVGFEISDYLEISDWQAATAGPGAGSGYQSCWLAPEGNFFEVTYVPDDLSDKDPTNWTFGWNMKVLLGDNLAAPVGVEDYRGTTGLSYQLLGEDLQTRFGNELGVSPLVVRFQGVRSVGPIQDYCNAEEGSEPNLLNGSLTPWLNSPEEVAGYWDLQLPTNPGLAAKRRANLVRAQIVLDRDAVGANEILAVVELSIRCIPD